MKLSRKILSLILSLTMLACTGQFALAAQEDAAGDGVTGGDNGANTEQAAGAAALGKEGEDYAAGEVIVVFEKGTTNSKVNEILSDNDATFESKTRVDGNTVALASIDEGTSVAEAVGELSEEKKVAYAQPNYKYTIKGTPDPYLKPTVIIKGGKEISNPKYQKQFVMTKAKEAWAEVESGLHAQTTVAVIDTGVDIGHVDLKGNLADSAKTSYMQFAYGGSKATKGDTGDHGSHVAGIIAATYDNGNGGAGIASGTNNDLVKLLPVCASDDGESLFTIDIVNGMNYAAAQGADVINMSFGANFKDRVEGEAIKALYYNKGITFVAAAGNEYSDEYSDPSDMKEVISVCNYNAAVTKGEVTGQTVGFPSTGSNYGIAKDIAAPGEGIWSTTPGNQYAMMGGTSMSTPVVSGICALMLDVNPDLTPAQVRNIICATADKDTAITNNLMGAGKINAKKAVQAAKAASASTPVESVEIDAALGEDSKKHMEIDIDDSAFEDKGYGIDTIVRPAESLADITWESSDESVATVDANGIVNGVSAGTCVITATAGGKSDSVEVTVSETNDPASIELTDTIDEMIAGTWDDLSGAVKVTAKDPSKALTNDEIYWESSDPSVVFTELGYIEARGSGTATITVSTYNGVKTSFTIRVISLPQKITLTKTTPWVRYGTSFTFAANLVDNVGAKMTGSGAMYWKVSPKSCGTIGKTSGRFTPTAEGVKKGYAYVIAAATETNIDGAPVEKAKKVIILKKNYKGKTDYALKKVTVKKRSARISWKKIPAADRYLVQRAAGTKGKFKTIRTVKSSVVLKSGGRLYYTDKKLKKNRIYRYRIRAQFKENGARKQFGFSNTIKLRTKK